MNGDASAAPPGRGLAAALAPRFRIERELGGGGMSRVFLAHELELDRRVVIKVVSPELAEGLSGERFAREIRLAARLQQANIVPLLHAGVADGAPYYAMPYVRGESLRAALAERRTLPVETTVGILRDVARALAYAHGEGVVHRDVKPENVLLSAGTAVVTDFGIAKALSASRTSADAGLTQSGVAVGTPAYMAPEQALGDDVDARADLYAWGVMAYELLAGAHPFAAYATPQRLVAAHLTEHPRPLAEARAGVPAPLATLVTRCLEKDPELRPQSAGELLAALDAVATPAAPAPASSPRPARRARVAGAALAVVLTLAAALAAGRRRADSAPDVALASARASARASAADARLDAIAVLPFANTGGDARDEYFSDGMTDELAHALSRLPGLQIAGRSSSYAFKGRATPAPEIGRVLDVGAIVEGTVRRSGDRLRVTAQLTRARDGRVLWSDSFERAGGDVFAVQDAFTSAISAALAPLLGTRPPPVARVGAAGALADVRGTRDAQAYDRYLRGRYFWAQRGAAPLDSATRLFREAVARDASFARGWAGLALAEVMRSNYDATVAALPAFDRAEAAARRALALDSTMADAYATIGMVRLRRFDLPAADAAFAAARRLEPQSAVAHHWSAFFYGMRADRERCDAEMALALAADPLSPTTRNTRSVLFSDQRRFREALDAAASVVALGGSLAVFTGPSRPLIWSGLADSAVAVERQRNAAGSVVRGRLGGLAFAYAAAGRWDAAGALRARIERGDERGTLAVDRALAAVAFGERARAAALFVESFEREGTIGNVAFTICDPVLDAVRDEPAWAAFLARHGLGECPYRSPWPIAPAPTPGGVRTGPA